jgi:hypothetical protein
MLLPYFRLWVPQPLSYANMPKYAAGMLLPQVSELHRQLAPHMLRRLKKDVLKQLPPKMEQMVSHRKRARTGRASSPSVIAACDQRAQGRSQGRILHSPPVLHQCFFSFLGWARPGGQPVGFLDLASIRDWDAALTHVRAQLSAGFCASLLVPRFAL